MARQNSGFGYSDPNRPAVGSKYHPGVDYAGPTGTPIYTNVPLTVTKAGVGKGYGNVVYATDSNGTEYRYGHLESVPNLKPGQQIPAGGLVAHVGNTGASTGSHLHYEVRKNGILKDPNSIDPDTGKPYTHATTFTKGKGTLDSEPMIADKDRKPGSPAPVEPQAKPKEKPDFREEQLNRMKEAAKREQNPRPVGDARVGLQPNRRHQGTR